MDFRQYGPLVGIFLFTGLVTAHGGHESVPEGSAVSLDPIVRAGLLRSGPPSVMVECLLTYLVYNRTPRYGRI